MQYSKLKKDSLIEKPEELHFVTFLTVQVKEIIGANADYVEISNRVLKHIVEQRGVEAEDIISLIPHILLNPTKITKSFTKKSDRYLFAKMNGRARGMVLEVTKTPDGNRVVSAFFIKT